MRTCLVTKDAHSDRRMTLWRLSPCNSRRKEPEGDKYSERKQNKTKQKPTRLSLLEIRFQALEAEQLLIPNQGSELKQLSRSRQHCLGSFGGLYPWCGRAVN